jgi:SAM-dependent methyltransferase
LQERFLLAVLARSRMPFGNILELGCGFGRVTKLLAETFPKARITALDLSPDQLSNARRHCGEAANIAFEQYDFYSGLPFPGSGYDAAVAIEVFLHHPEDVVYGLLERLHHVSRHIINIDWSESWPWETAGHVWVHDYRALYEQAGLECATFVLPQKADGMQQKLFIAGAALAPELRNLEKRMQGQRETRALPEPSQTVSTLSDSARWAHEVHLAINELRKLVPTGSSLILVNEDQWGNEREALKHSRVIPFLERGGQYWGPPPDDETAIRELERLRRDQADYIAFAWPCFWWLHHYTRFFDYLRERYTCVRSDDCLIVFDLK